MDGQDEKYKVEDLMGGGDCQDALHTLYVYLDGELTPERRSAIRRHLEECSPCLQAFDFEAELKKMVARSCRDQVPSRLQEKVAEILAKASEFG
jgi:mycothiol system anti-sigma-R factor